MDNTVGSLTQTQQSIIIGTILGDGYVRIVKGRKNAFLEINHSLKQKEYVDWKYNRLRSIAAGEPHSRKSNGNREAYRFHTKQLPELTILFRKFYKNGRKNIPKIHLDPLMLAVWFMDDGSKSRGSDIYLNTQQFDNKDQQCILHMLSEMNLEARLNKDKHYQRVRFMKSSLPRLKEIIYKHVIPSMKYKIEL